MRGGSRWWVGSMVATVALAAPAPAQEALSLLDSQPDGPLVSEPEVKALVRLAELTPDQAEVASTLREGLAADFKAANRRLQAAQEEAQSDAQDHPRVDQATAYAAAGRQFRDKCADLERGFLVDVKGILTGAQAEHWPDFERFRRRVHSTGWWQRPAADADLVKVVEGLKLEPAQAAAVRPLLDEYERELDPAVIARLAVKREAADAAFTQDDQRRQDWSRAYDQTQPIDQRLAGINRKYARLLTPLLPAPRQDEFSTHFAEACFINLYTPSEARKRIDAAEKLADLTDQQKTDLERIIGSFRRGVVPVEKEAERLEDEQAYQYTYQQLNEGKAPRGYNNRYDEIYSMEGKALGAVRKVLTDAQREKIDGMGED